MTWLRNKDYFPYMREDKLNEVLYNDTTLLTSCERASVEEAASYLRHRYDTKRIFKDIQSYADVITFFPQDIIEWVETIYDTGTTYNIDDRCSYSDKIYKCKENGVTGVWDISKWTLLADNESLWYAIIKTQGNLPNEAITYTTDNYTTRYDLIEGWDREVNTSLYFKRDGNYLYIYLTEAARDSGGISEARIFYPEEGLRLPALADIELWDNKTISGQLQLHGHISDETIWQVDTTKYWTEGDNRNPKLLQTVIDIVLYHIHSRIQPRNIPTLRMVRYNGGVPEESGGAIGFLKGARKGINTLDLPEYMNETKGQNIDYGSENKTNWNY